MSFDKFTILFSFFLFSGLNPFRAGRCLSTWYNMVEKTVFSVSIPFEQGDVFRLSLDREVARASRVSIPFDQGNVFRLLFRKKDGNNE